MPSRWSVLALLFAVRTAMAIQYQSVAAVAPLLTTAYGVGIADVGFLISLYLLPGIVLALPGSSIGRKFGDKTSVLAGLALMTVGGTIMVVSESWGGQIFGRLVAGIGGVLLNVLMSKMIVDWFAGREIATAMAIFVNSWPVGIAIALVLLPSIAVDHGLQTALLGCTALVVLGLIALMLLYWEPPETGQLAPATPGLTAPDRAAMLAVLAAGLVWSFYNAGLAMVFGFGPSMLVERGWAIDMAGSAVSVALWLVTLSVPLGGYMADRFKRPATVIVGACLPFAALMLAAARLDTVVWIFVAIGLVGGLPAGAIMSLPARFLGPHTRAIGMGMYFTVFYAGMVAGPLLGGLVGNLFGTAAATFDLGALLVMGCCLSLGLYLKLANAAAPVSAHAAPS